MEIMQLQTYGAFLAASTILLVIPGPTVLTVISYSLSHGKRANIPLVAAVVLGHSTVLSLSFVGLGGFFASSTFWVEIIKLFAGIYLIYLGVEHLCSGARSIEAWEAVKAVSLRHLFTKTYIVTALNPNSIMFFMAFLPQFVNRRGHVMGQLLLLAISFVALGALNVSMYSIFASSAHNALNSYFARRYLHIVGGSLLSATGVWALFA